MSRYTVLVEDAEEVWPPVLFDDFLSAIRHAITLAKGFGTSPNSPRIGILGDTPLDYQSVDWYLRAEMMIGYVEGSPKTSRRR